MRTILLFILCLSIPLGAAEWRNEIFRCGADIPSSPGWQTTSAPPAPDIEPVLVMQNAARGSVLGIHVVDKFKHANLTEPAVQRDIEEMLKRFGYQVAGHATVTIGGTNWLQYPVRAGTGQAQVSGIIRYAAMGGHVFAISLLRSGGQDVAQDGELQKAAATFRALPAVTDSPSPAGNKTVSASAPKASAEPEPEEEDHSRARLIWAGGIGLVVLVLFLSIITKKPAR